jgi:ATP/maltotriose-dependent transcriptional regulator MalT
MFEETGAEGRAGWAKAMLASIALRRRNYLQAEELARDAVRRLRASKEHGFLVEAERTLAEVLVKQGRLTEAERVAEHALKTVGQDDVWSRASTLHAVALVRAAQGRQGEAESLLRESLAILEPTMYRVFADEVRQSLEQIVSRPEPAGHAS